MVSLTPYWTPFRYAKVQVDLWNCKSRYIAAVAGRSSGKTELARRRTVISLAIKKPWPNPIYVYALPTYAQAKKVAWTPLLNLIPENWIVKNGINVTDMSIKTIFGSTLYIVGMDKPHRVEGLQVDGIVLDESSDQKIGVFDLTIVPMLRERNGWCWRIGVPKRSGIGRVDFKSFFDMGLIPENNNISSFHWKSAEVLTPEQIEDAQRLLDPQDFDEQFNATWIDAGGTVYHAFTRDNISEEASYNPNLDIHVGCDFNVDPMCWVLCQVVKDRLYVFDEIFIRNTSTESTLKALKAKYPTHRKEWRFYGDASGRARKTSAVKTDYASIKNSDFFHHKKVFFPPKNPHVRDRYAAVNAMMCNAKGEIRVYIHPQCKKLINDLYIISYKEKTTEVEDYSGTDIGHMSDALGYLIYRRFPIKLKSTAVPVVITS